MLLLTMPTYTSDTVTTMRVIVFIISVVDMVKVMFWSTPNTITPQIGATDVTRHIYLPYSFTSGGLCSNISFISLSRSIIS